MSSTEEYLFMEGRKRRRRMSPNLPGIFGAVTFPFSGGEEGMALKTLSRFPNDGPEPGLIKNI